MTLNLLSKRFNPSKVSRRSSLPLFMGRNYLEDKFTFAEQYQIEAKIAFENGNEDKFISICFNFMKHLETLKPSEPLWINSQFMVNCKNSYIYNSYVDIFRMSFSKALNAVYPQYSPSSNHSGYYVVGRRGVGKTVLLQTSCLVTGQLLPHFTSLYIDCVTNREYYISNYLAHLHNSYCENVEDHVPLDADINIILGSFQKQQVAVGLFIDEAHERFHNKQDWPTLHGCATAFQYAVFLGGSDAALPPRVRLTASDIAHLKSTGDYDFPHTTLNTTKLSPIAMVGFTSKNHYLDYFAKNPVMFRELFEFSLKESHHIDLTHCISTRRKERNIPPQYVNDDTVLSELLIDMQSLEETEEMMMMLKHAVWDILDAIHILTAGRIRSLIALRTIRQSVAGILDFHLSDIIDEFESLKPFFDMIELKNNFDPFDLPTLNVISSSGKHSSTAQRGFSGDVNLLTRKQMITYSGDNMITLSTPAVYYVHKLLPSVFVSHAHTDKSNLVPSMNIMKSANIAVVCTSDQNTETLQSIEKHHEPTAWEKDQIDTALERNRYIVIVLSDIYCQRVDSAGNDSSSSSGCRREWLYVLKLYKEHTNFQKKVIFTYIGDYQSNVVGSVKEFLGHRTLLNFETDQVALLIRLFTNNNNNK